MSHHYLYRGIWCRNAGDESVVNEIEDDAYRTAELPAPPHTLLDIGANIGAFSISAARRWPRARITAFEPEASNFAMLERNLAHAGVTAAVSPVRAAMWAPNVAELTVTDDGAGSVTSVQGDGDTVPTVTLDAVVAGCGHVDLAKIDIEGAEVDVLLGAAPDTMRQISRIIGEFHGSNDPRWTEWLRYVAAFFEVTVVAHPYPLHPYGGLFWANPRRP